MGRDLLQDARQTVVANDFPVAGSARGKADGPAGFVCNQCMGLGTANVNAEIIFHG